MSVPHLVTVWKGLCALTRLRAQASFVNVLLVLLEMADTPEMAVMVDFTVINFLFRTIYIRTIYRLYSSFSNVNYIRMIEMKPTYYT